MNELQTLESIIKDSPRTATDISKSNLYYVLFPNNWAVWDKEKQAFYPVSNKTRFHTRSLADIQKQIDQFKEIEGLRDQLDAWAEKYADLKIKSDANQWAHDNMQEQLASANEEIKSTKLLLGWKWERLEGKG